MKFSIITPTYNSCEFLKRAIDSVLIQDYKNYEHIVIDGGSSDGTIKLLESYPHLIWISEPDSGQSDAMNKGFDISTGEIISYLNADDFYEVGAFEKVYLEFMNNAESSIVVGDLKIEFLNLQANMRVVKPEIDILKLLLPQYFAFPYNPVSYFYRREVQISVGNFDINEHFAMDFKFLLDSFMKFNVTKVDFILGSFFVTGYNKTSLHNDGSKNLRNIKRKFLRKQNFAFNLRYLIFYFRITTNHYLMKIQNNVTKNFNSW